MDSMAFAQVVIGTEQMMNPLPILVSNAAVVVGQELKNSLYLSCHHEEHSGNYLDL